MPRHATQHSIAAYLMEGIAWFDCQVGIFTGTMALVCMASVDLEVTRQAGMQRGPQ